MPYGDILSKIYQHTDVTNMQIVDKNCGRTAKPPSATAIAAITASIGCIDARDKRVLAVLSTKMSSEEVIGDTSLIFVIIAEGSRCSWTVITSTIAAIEIAESPLIPIALMVAMGDGGSILKR